MAIAIKNIVYYQHEKVNQPASKRKSDEASNAEEKKNLHSSCKTQCFLCGTNKVSRTSKMHTVLTDEFEEKIRETIDSRGRDDKWATEVAGRLA